MRKINLMCGLMVFIAALFGGDVIKADESRLYDVESVECEVLRDGVLADVVLNLKFFIKNKHRDKDIFFTVQNPRWSSVSVQNGRDWRLLEGRAYSYVHQGKTLSDYKYQFVARDFDKFSELSKGVWNLESKPFQEGGIQFESETINKDIRSFGGIKLSGRVQCGVYIADRGFSYNTIQFDVFIRKDEEGKYRVEVDKVSVKYDDGNP